MGASTDGGPCQPSASQLLAISIVRPLWLIVTSTACAVRPPRMVLTSRSSEPGAPGATNVTDNDAAAALPVCTNTAASASAEV
jgi:hypothetical protein